MSPLPKETTEHAGCCSSVVEHFLGKEEVTSSILVNSSNTETLRTIMFGAFLFIPLPPYAKHTVSKHLTKYPHRLYAAGVIKMIIEIIEQ